MISPRIGSAINAILKVLEINPDFAFRTVELSLQDQSILDNWFKQKFEKWTKTITEMFSEIPSQRSSSDKVNLINEIHSQLCLVEAYHNAISIPFLTDLGKQEMNVLVVEFVNALTSELAVELSKLKTVEASFNLPFRNIDPIITEPIKTLTTYKCFQYALTRVDPTEEIPVDYPADEIPVDYPADETPVDTTIQDTATEIVQETKKSGFNWWWLVAGYIGYKVLK
uniref:hypothetical protein n=1 Tax=Flavobacterium sp. TaxID=239 RepID=UPI0040481FE4